MDALPFVTSRPIPLDAGVKLSLTKTTPEVTVVCIYVYIF